MKIAISSSGRNLDVQVDPRFGRCNCFVVIDPETQAFEVLENEAATLGSGAGIQAAQMVVKAGAEAVITGSVGPNAKDVLSAAGLKIYLGAAGTIKEVLQQYQDGRLQEASVPSAAAGLGGGQGGGRGMGRGMGRGGGRGRGFRAGPGGYCICPSCGERAPHQLGTPCFEHKCPKCGTVMTRER
ncbi:MAG: NifB/NifX family molybdenum-iron cluster-binding protein [Deltaproteobacteria bacterium]|nr:NifB/NifX family molybdenum-iron cluster-binding protein [Deltaproteobacteria bacterium]MBW2100532.1 NifB/NifX family molybdenum-iron cluster-binding protein [Deltaproteobacteria bacterium]